MSDFDILNGLSYKEMEDVYTKNFSLGYLEKNIQTKFALIGLICYLTYKAKLKQPGITHWQIIIP